jgi:hypothetical protein
MPSPLETQCDTRTMPNLMIYLSYWNNKITGVTLYILAGCCDENLVKTTAKQNYHSHMNLQPKAAWDLPVFTLWPQSLAHQEI